MTLKLWTDGSISNKLKKSGWSAIFSKNEKIVEKTFGQCELTTSANIEIIAIIEGLKYYKKFLYDNQRLEVYTDAKFIYDVINRNYWKKWDFNNRNINWEILKNLIEDLNENNISFHWIPSHSNFYFNILADRDAKLSRLL
mgnify:CR=1 FL=1